MAAIPVPYIGTGNQSQSVLGHYSVAQRSGEIAATLAAGAHLARIRWAPTGATNTFLVLMRLKIGWSISAQVTDCRIEQAYRAIIARSFTVDFTTAMTAINLATTNTGRSNAMRFSMGGSLMGANGPGICTTVAMSGQTMTVDAAPFAIATTAPAMVATNSVGTVTIGQAGASTPMQTLYEWTGLGQHPVVLSNNEGVIVQNQLAGYATGTFALYTQWEFAEVLVF